MAKKQNSKVKKEETIIEVKPEVKKKQTTTKPKTIKPKVVKEEVKPLQLEDLMVEIKNYKDLLVTAINEMESKQDVIDALNKVIVEKENDVLSLTEDLKDTSIKLEYATDELIESNKLKESLNGIPSFVRYYKRQISTNYGLTSVNIIFSLVMFVLFGISILTAFGFKYLVGDVSNISVLLISSFASTAIVYFLYLVNWKK
jgi:hypothetical protein